MIQWSKYSLTFISFYLYGMEISMKYKVNELCIGCGLCEAVCPEVFSLKDGGTAVAVDTDVPKELEANAKEAMTGCPVGAIEEI